MRFVICSCVLFMTALGTCVLAGQDNPAEPALPKDISPLPKDLADRMKQLIRAAEDNRGLPCKHGVPCGSLGEEVLRKKMVESFHEELPPEKMGPLEATLKNFGFIPADMDLAKYYPELLTSQVGGYYDPRRQYLVIVQREGGLLGKELKQQYGDALAQRMEETVIVHELTHAIQDQHFDMKKFLITDPLSDEGAAHLALVEGDATLTMYNYFAGMKLENLPNVEAVITELMKDPKQLIEMSPDMPGAKEMASAPAYFRDNMLFSYMQGYVFCLNVKKTGGQRLLDYAFTKDPPRSTEQIMHPEKWHTKRDDPVAIELPDLAAQLPGWKKVVEGQLGEQSIKVLLREWTKDEPTASKAAAGWGGDRFALYSKDGRNIIAWVTEWDSKEDRKEFHEAFQKNLDAFAKGNWVATDEGDTRTVLVSNVDLAGKGLIADLQKARATRPENKNIDLATIAGRKNGDLPKGDQDLTDLLNDPEMKKMVERLTRKDGENGGEQGGLEGLDIGKLMDDPNVQAMVKSMLNQERPEGNASEDKRSYTNEELGFTIKAPPSQKDWKVDPKPPVPLASVMVSNPEGTVQVMVVNQQMPMAVPLEMLAPSLELAPKMSVQDYKRIKNGAIKTGDKPGHELQFEGVQAGNPIRSTLRVYVEGNNMLMVTATTTKDNWDKNEKAINETLDSFQFIDKKKGAAEKKPAPQPKPQREPAPEKAEPLKE